mmetsp:Transcript_64081/g.134725  ORF Transcript_64081/g.134725 Transcript_64081/m.134725 type:complete len:656 (+) Transcript_64081:111-2078(+)
MRTPPRPPAGVQRLSASLASWPLAAISVLLLVLLADVAPTSAEEPVDLLKVLEDAADEDAATQILMPYLENLKELKPEVVEKVVLRQWWTLAREIVAKSHVQQVDLSFAIRKAVRTLKDEADELLRTLNPKYGQAQQVAPAFQWAQNDTCIFLSVKYTVRWNAPGALEVTEPNVNMTLNTFNFSGLGKHSNNKYRYFLSLNLFDNIVSEFSQWSAASVGKLSVTLRKKWPRKWPRLIANKKAKIGNMHMWMEMQEKLDSALSGMTTVSNSPVTCKMLDKLYCLATDTCKQSDGCEQCPGKTVPQAEEGICTGMPSEKATLTFKDADMDEGELSGELKITKAKNEFDIDSYEVYWGKDEKTKWTDASGANGPPVTSTRPTGGDAEIKIPSNTKIPEGASHILVYSKNSYGEYDTPGWAVLKDAVLPKGKPTSLKFDDEDGDTGEVSGTVTIGRAEDQQKTDEYALHWGKSDKKRINSGSFIRDVMKQADRDPTHHISSSTKIPDGATHILAYAKNEFGEFPSPASIRIVDNKKPCLEDGAADCPVGVTVSPDTNPEAQRAQATITIAPAADQEKLSFYSVYWGRKGCNEGGQSGAKNGHIKDVPTDNPTWELPANTFVPKGTTHILVFSKSKLGESDRCVSTEFQDVVVETPNTEL